MVKFLTQKSDLSQKQHLSPDLMPALNIFKVSVYPQMGVLDTQWTEMVHCKAFVKRKCAIYLS